MMSYQGFLSDPDTGSALPDGTYNMHFSIFDSAAAGSLLWEEPAGPAVLPVHTTNGVFTVLLGQLVPLSPSVFASGSTYLEVVVDGQTLTPRQPILSVAYALVAQTIDGQSLANLDERFVNSAGDSMSGDLVAEDRIRIGTSGDPGGVRISDSSDKVVFDFGGLLNFGSHNLRMWDATNPDPVFRFGADAALLTLGASGNEGDLQIKNSADSTTISLDGAAGHIVLGAPGEDGDLWIEDDTGTPSILFEGSLGNIAYNGSLNGAFPRPAYDSGFLTYADGGESKTLNHNIGGDPDDYVVDLQCKYAGDGYAHSYYMGGDEDDAGAVRGLAWDNLLSNSIVVVRFSGDPFCDQARVRIWVIK